MRVAVIGTGYVGLVTGACFAEVGHEVVCMDTVQEKIDALQQGIIQIYEDGLEEMVARNTAAGRLCFTTSLAEALAEAEAVFLTIGTPEGEDGSADLSMVLKAAEQIGATLDHGLIVVQKSTCPVGTSREVERRVSKVLVERGVEFPFHVVSNPEFLREGSAVRDFMRPDRVVIGADDEESGRRVASLYEKLATPDRVLIMDLASAELTKYASNAFLAMKISFINDIANLCELVGADVENIRRGIGADVRIGPAFLAAGIGYGGSCFPKDVKALVQIARNHGYGLRIIEAVDAVNREQRERQVEKILRFFGGNLSGRRVAVLGVAFKPGTDDMREAPAITTVAELLANGASVVAYDPVAMDNARKVLDPVVHFASDALACVEGADAVVLMTEWPEFLRLDLEQVGARMKQRVLFDLRNAFSPASVAEAGFAYIGVGRVINERKPAAAGM